MPKNYTEDDIQKALAAVKNGMSKKRASQEFGIPRATIQFRLKNDLMEPKPGPSTVLTAKEEKAIVDWIISSSKKGFPRRKEDVLYSVEQFLEKNPRENPFINNKPGEGWYRLFLKRHPEISCRTVEAVTSASANVSEQNVRKWFKQIEDALKDEQCFEILQDPDRVFNGDETGFQLCPKLGKVLAPKGARDVYEVDMGPPKSSITVMFTFSASGIVTPPSVIYPLKRMRTEIVESVPSGWGISVSDNGWMTKEIFYQYITNAFHPYLISKNITLPVILFVDGHKSHINYDLSMKCKELGIILIALYPNATRILQPADVAAFKPIKNGWRKALLDWRRNNVSKQLTKVDFGHVLTIVLDKFISKRIIQNGFRACGLYPWDPNAINYAKCLGGKKQDTDMSIVHVPTQEKSLTMTDFLRIVDPSTINKLKKEIQDEENCFYKALSNIYTFLKNEEIINKETQNQLLVEDTWIPIDEIPIVVTQNQHKENCFQNSGQDSLMPETELEDIVDSFIENETLNSSTLENCIIDWELQAAGDTEWTFTENQNMKKDAFNIETHNSEKINKTGSDNDLETGPIKENITTLENCKTTSEFQNKEDLNKEKRVEVDSDDKNKENIVDINEDKKKKDIINYLHCPPTPARKKKKIPTTPIYLLTGNKWLEKEKEKIKDKEKLIADKEQRKKLREHTKQAKAEQKPVRKRKQKIEKEKPTKVVIEVMNETAANNIICETKAEDNKIFSDDKIHTTAPQKQTSTQEININTVNKISTTVNNNTIKTKADNIIIINKEIEKETDPIIEFKDETMHSNKPLINRIDSSKSVGKETDSKKKIKILSISCIPPVKLQNVKKKLFISDNSTKAEITHECKDFKINAVNSTFLKYNESKTGVVKSSDYYKTDLNSKSRKRKLDDKQDMQLINMKERHTDTFIDSENIKTEQNNNEILKTDLLTNSKKMMFETPISIRPDYNQPMTNKDIIERRATFRKILQRRTTFKNDKELQEFINAENSDM